MRQHDYIYFYKDGYDRVPILTGSSNKFKNIIHINDEEKKAISKLLPSDKRLYVFIDSHVFRL